MIPKEYRLKKRKEFNYAYKNGKSISTKYMSLCYLTANRKNAKIGFSVSKKVGKAFLRNKIKRQFRAIMKKYVANIEQKFTYIFIAKPDITLISFTEIEKNMLYLLKKANLIKENINA